MKQKDGGPAFPPQLLLYAGSATQFQNMVRDLERGGEGIPGTGMTLRDWFAGQAIAGLLSNIEAAAMSGDPQSSIRRNAAKVAYVFADALLAEREGE